jgi:uncharacterized membrane protein YhiD involved in acid resistance
MRNFKLYLLNIIGFLAANPAFLVALLLLIVIVGTAAFVHSCNERRQQEKLERKKENIIKEKTEANVLQNQIIDQQHEAREAEDVRREALDNVNAVEQKDSQEYEANFNTAKKKFCELYPDDSLCRK